MVKVELGCLFWHGYQICITARQILIDTSCEALGGCERPGCFSLSSAISFEGLLKANRSGLYFLVSLCYLTEDVSTFSLRLCLWRIIVVSSEVSIMQSVVDAVPP